MKSMTGYGASEYRQPTFELRVSIRAVNGRFLDPRLHLPREYAPLENDLKKLIQQRIQRGTVEVHVHRRGAHRNGVKVVVREEVAAEWLRAHNRLAKQLGLKKAEFSAREVGVLPHVFELQEQPAQLNREKPILLRLMRQALLRLDQHRRREGRALQREFRKYLRALNGLAAQMERLQGGAQVELQRRLLQRVQDLGIGLLEPQRLAQEVAFLVEKADIAEEIVRLREHLRQCARLVASSRAEGKRLEFYIQELLRESNTIGSKSYTSKLTACVVEAKTLIERMKEQVQNIE